MWRRRPRASSWRRRGQWFSDHPWTTPRQPSAGRRTRVPEATPDLPVRPVLPRSADRARRKRRRRRPRLVHPTISVDNRLGRCAPGKERAMSSRKQDRGRFSSKRKMEAVVRLLGGEDLDLLSRELGVTAAPEALPCAAALTVIAPAPGALPRGAGSGCRVGSSRVSSPDRALLSRRLPRPAWAPVILGVCRTAGKSVESPTPSLPTMTTSGLVSVALSPDSGPHPAGKRGRRGGLDAEGRSGHRSPPNSPLATLQPAPTSDPRPAVSASFLEASHALSVPSRRGATPHDDLAFFQSPGHPRIQRVLRNAPWRCFPARGIGQHRSLTAAPPVSCLTNATHTPDNRPNTHYCGSARPRS